MTCEINNAIYDFKEVHFYGALFHSNLVELIICLLVAFLEFLLKKSYPLPPKISFEKPCTLQIYHHVFRYKIIYN